MIKTRAFWCKRLVGSVKKQLTTTDGLPNLLKRILEFPIQFHLQKRGCLSLSRGEKRRRNLMKIFTTTAMIGSCRLKLVIWYHLTPERTLLIPPWNAYGATCCTSALKLSTVINMSVLINKMYFQTFFFIISPPVEGILNPLSCAEQRHCYGCAF